MMEVYSDDYTKEEPDEFEYYYYPIETIASGAFGTVIKALDLNTQKEVAVKIIIKANHSRQALKQIEQEVEILKRLDHKHIVSFETFMETQHKMYIVMEYLGGGTLQQYLQTNYLHLKEEQTKIIISSLLSAVNYLHSRDICHRDIKPENIMLKKYNDISSIKLVDFGLSSQFFEHKEVFNFCGTLLYIAPEQIQNKTYSKKIDIWSVGIILFMVLNEGKHPLWSSKDSKEKYLTKLIRHQIEVFNPCSKIIRSLLMKLLEGNPCLRYTAQNALDHPWITGRKYDPIPKTVFEILKEQEIKKKMIYLVKGALFALHYQKKERDEEEEKEEIAKEYENKIKETNVFYSQLFIKKRDDDFNIKKREHSPYSNSRPLSPRIAKCTLYKLNRNNSQQDMFFKEKKNGLHREFNKYMPSINNNYNSNINNNNNSLFNTSRKGNQSSIRKIKITKISYSNNIINGYNFPFCNAKNSINIYIYNSKQIAKAHIKHINSFKKNSFNEDELRRTMTPFKERKRCFNESINKHLNIQINKKTPEPKIIHTKHMKKIISKFSMPLPKIQG